MTAPGYTVPAHAALAAVYERHHRALYRYCRSIVHHEQDAQDALQSAMTRAIAALEATPSDADLRPWLFRIAHNEAVSIVRRRRPLAELDAELADLGAVHERVERQETLRLLHQDLADLPERQRAALVLRELSGFAPREIAELLGTTPGAVKQSILEARRALSRCAEGRATPCFEVQRALSDGDGRVLRARGLRAHLRSCPSCRRFRGDLERRPGALAALAPPLPAGAFSALQAGATTAALPASAGVASGALAKMTILAVVATGAAAGGHALRDPASLPRAAGHVTPAEPAAAHAKRVAPPRPAPVLATAREADRAGADRVPAIAHRDARRRVSSAVASAPRQVKPAAQATGAAAAPARIKPAAGAPGQVKKHAGAPGRATAPGQVKKQAGTPGAAMPPGQAKKQAGTTGAAMPPGQAKKQAGTTGAATAPGQAKKQAGTPGAATAPGQAKKPAAPDAAAQAPGSPGAGTGRPRGRS